MPSKQPLENVKTKYDLSLIRDKAAFLLGKILYYLGIDKLKIIFETIFDHQQQNVNLESGSKIQCLNTSHNNIE